MLFPRLPIVTRAAVGLASLAVACSSSHGGSASAAPDDAGPVIDGSLGPFLCDLPVASTCPVTAPCAFSGWSCDVAACDGYEVITDGTWVYYYSLPSGQLAGEVATDDAGAPACPYEFQPPTGCTPAVAGQCASDAGPAIESD